MARVMLQDGKEVEISSVLFNKDQRINVSKTYVSTVKKPVTRVSEEFYKVEKSKEEKGNIFNTLPNEEIVKTPILAEPEMKMPEINAVEEGPVQPVPDVEPVKEETITLAEPMVTSQTPTMEGPQIQPVLVTEPISEPITMAPVEEPKSEVDVPSFVSSPVEKPQEIKLQPELEVPETLLEPTVSPVATPAPIESEINKVVEPTPVIPAAPVVQTPLEPISPVKTETPAVEEAKLFFDGTNENNLNKALNEVSEEKVVTAPQEGVESLREFGTDEPVVAPTVDPVQEAPVAQDVKKLTRSKGFANNKFFMVIAIAFFLAACVFLGYEAFQYFTLK